MDRTSPSPVDYRCGVWTIHTAERRVSCKGSAVELEAKVFDLIVLLLENRQRALDKEEIVRDLWGTRPVTDAALSQLVYKARRVFADNGGQQAVIRTVYGRGLQWVATVEPVRGGTQSIDPASPPAASATAPPRHVRTRLLWPGVAVLLMASLASMFLVVRYDHATPTSHPPRVALLPIDNATGESAENWTSHGLPGLIGSLLGTAPGIDVIDPIEVAHLWGFAVPAGKTRTEHMRQLTGAAIIISGRLRKLGTLYELALRVDREAGRSGKEIKLTGAKPGVLAVDAVARIRHALHLQPQSARTLEKVPGDPYLAQTFARGMDAGMRGRWSDARPYFALCATAAPDFMPCRLRLGQAEANSNQLAQAQQTLESLLVAARKRGDTGAAAAALFQLAGVALTRHAHTTALKRLQAAAVLAKRLDHSDLEARIALKAVDVAARLKRFTLAQRQLHHARELIADAGLRSRQSDLYNSEAFLASIRGDYAAAEKANRKALAASTAAGNQANAVGDAYNLGLNLLRQHKTIEALPLLAYTYRQGGKLKNPRLEFFGGDNLAILLLNAGATKPLPAINQRLLEIGKQQHNAVWRAYAWILRGGRQWDDGDRAAALASARKSVALVDSRQAPALWIALQYNVALAALFEDRKALAALAKQVDAVVAAQPKPADYAYSQQLIRAMAAASTGDRGATLAALRKAAASKHPEDAEADDLHRAGLAIALAIHDPEAARIALAGFDASRCHMADVLQLAEQWAQRQGDTQMVRATRKRLLFLRKAAVAALHDSPLGTSAGP